MLKDYNFKSIYSSGELTADPVDFFNNALSRSVKLDIGLGFFSSASINVLSLGFARFITNGGKMRLYINQYLSDEDYEALVSQPEKIEESVIQNFYSMFKILSKRDEHFFNCLSSYWSCAPIFHKNFVFVWRVSATGALTHPGSNPS